MRIDILSLFPTMFQPLKESILGKAIEKELLDIEITDFREYTTQKQHHVDDTPYGGGAGMLLQAQPIFDAVAATQKKATSKGRIILLDPAGRKFDQEVATQLAKEDHLTFICGHYEGYDERIRSLVTDELSLGDYVLTGGELAAMVMIDATVRLLPDVLGNSESAQTDSFATGLLEHPQYTRPADFQGMKVPEVLMSGNHEKIAEWRHKESLRRTFERRPDLLIDYSLTAQEKKWLSEFEKNKK
ncbi:tRNA (guanosine(37)-N1)-methyltransferase TrmD [Ligilactobacillus sp. WILCCON 0076]|uniref:tRNA (guanine-N(1)-)-methyltransferase n=1 Tax=Ligilactobacillus ubinensis TaxID=2876789 RepID=A0A9X2JLH4_9LACO|nr:tRNA (guanosine(37)-N1)-methyltransferase TrmD [Ligilactobacillus ubinensis]MCP0886978.1 tRNA (guanosine(37)-N1)-methyltransferase TrmD [Ligilactobacillus ubinensis]